MRPPILDREEYIEQAYFFRVYRERLLENVPSQEILQTIQEEILATTRLPMAIDFLRKRQLDTVSIDGSPHAASASEIEATSFDVVSRQESALEEMEAKELGSSIERAIAQLRPEYRSCIMLRHVEGRSYEEIAATLDLPLGTVKTYIHRARHQLREALDHVRD